MRISLLIALFCLAVQVRSQHASRKILQDIFTGHGEKGAFKNEKAEPLQDKEPLPNAHVGFIGRIRSFGEAMKYYHSNPSDKLGVSRSSVENEHDTDQRTSSSLHSRDIPSFARLSAAQPVPVRAQQEAEQQLETSRTEVSSQSQGYEESTAPAQQAYSGMPREAIAPSSIKDDYHQKTGASQPSAEDPPASNPNSSETTAASTESPPSDTQVRTARDESRDADNSVTTGPSKSNDVLSAPTMAPTDPSSIPASTPAVDPLSAPTSNNTDVVVPDTVRDSGKSAGNSSEHEMRITERLSQEMPISDSSSKYHITIGTSQVSRSRVTPVGDVDKNGYEDYIVSNPAANNHAGTIRLYLMTANNKFLYTRDLVPGKWGFNVAPLHPGDRFGAMVFKLPSRENVTSSFIAISAPGDYVFKQENGAVYVLQLSNRGNITNHAKISAKHFKEIVSEEVQSTPSGAPVSGHETNLSGAKSFSLEKNKNAIYLAGVASLLFLDREGNVKGSLEIDSEEDKNIIQEIDRHIGSKVARHSGFKLGPMGMKVGLAQSKCVFNETHCACAQKKKELGFGECLDTNGKDERTGKTICLKRACKQSRMCVCDGDELCERVGEQREILVSHGTSANGEIFCQKEMREVIENVLVPGAAVPKSSEQAEFPSLNATHCTCSRKNTRDAVSPCIVYERTDYASAIVCNPLSCRIPADAYICDAMGGSRCARQTVDKKKYVNDGPIPGSRGVELYCHEERYVEQIVTVVGL